MAEEIIVNTIDIHQILTDWRVWFALFIFYVLVGLFQRIGHAIWDYLLFKLYLKNLHRSMDGMKQLRNLVKNMKYFKGENNDKG